MGEFFHQVMCWVERQQAQDWLLWLTLVAVIGLVCMRGFGSRSGY